MNVDVSRTPDVSPSIGGVIVSENVHVDAVQAEPVWLDTDGTTDETVHLTVYEQRQLVACYHANSPTIDGPQMVKIREAAQRHSNAVIVGFSEKDGGSLYTSQAVIGPDGKTILHRRKLKPTNTERTLFGAGDGCGTKVVDTPLGQLGTLQCIEHLQPLTKYANEDIHVVGWPCLGSWTTCWRSAPCPS